MGGKVASIPKRLPARRPLSRQGETEGMGIMRTAATLLGFGLGLSLAAAPAVRAAERVLFDFEGGFNVSSVATNNTRVELVRSGNNTFLRMHMGHIDRWPGITLRPAGAGSWDLGAHDWVAVDLTNAGTREAKLALRVDGVGGTGAQNSQTEAVTLPAGASKTLKVWFRRAAPAPLNPADFPGMRSLPGGFFADAQTIDPRATTQLIIFGLDPDRRHTIDVDDVRAGGSYAYPAWLAAMPRPFFPMIDRFGQFAHATWPGKTMSEQDLASDALSEETDLRVNPGPRDLDGWGGWTAGPRVPPTGFFRPVKVSGKWWLATPDGTLFFSNGLDCVGPAEFTPIRGREHMFVEIPAPGTPLGFHWDNMFDFARANLVRKHGTGWWPIAKDLTHRRLRSWGFNTIGAWSDAEICLMRRTPYTVALGSEGRKIEGTAPAFPDVFDPAFAASLDRKMQAEIGKSAGDPWCIGYFIDNEIDWSWDDLTLAHRILAAPPDQPAKIAFVADLKAKYHSIFILNLRWLAWYRSWDDLLRRQTPPNRNFLTVRADLRDFHAKIAERYFSTCRAAIKRVAPQNLYLGCRFSTYNEAAVRAAARHCDVVGFNLYGRDVHGLNIPAGVDAPVVIGEYHFGALDRGPWHATGLPTDDQTERAAAFENYLRTALRHPAIVGAHWFQYRDQPATGRFDGENANIGFIDICDQPYPEMVAAARRLGADLYAFRFRP